MPFVDQITKLWRTEVGGEDTDLTLPSFWSPQESQRSYACLRVPFVPRTSSCRQGKASLCPDLSMFCFQYSQEMSEIRGRDGVMSPICLCTGIHTSVSGQLRFYSWLLRRLISSVYSNLEVVNVMELLSSARHCMENKGSAQ